MRTIGIGLIGVGGFGQGYVQALDGNPHAKIAGICDMQVQAAAELAAQCGNPPVTGDYRELLARSDIHAVCIATPHFLHHRMTMDALAAGKHVFCEKPLATTAADAYAMAAAARAKGLVLSCHYNQRQMAQVKLLTQVVRTNLIGTPYHVSMRWIARWTGFMFGANTGWRKEKAKAGGGILIGRGSHLIDAAWYILGKPRIASITAVCRSDLTGFEVDDYTTALLTCANGITISIEASYVLPTPHGSERMEYEVFGTAGGASWRKIDDVVSFGVGSLDLATGAWCDRTGDLDVAAVEKHAPLTIINDFIDAVVEGREPNVTGEEAAYISKLLEAGYESAALRRTVEVLG